MRSKLMQILASATMVAIAATGVTVLTATSAEAAEGQLQSYRACEELDVQMTDRHPQECVNGGRIATRGYPVATCLAQVNRPDEKPGFRYPRNTCTSEKAGVQAERIAQARFIQSLDGDNRAAGWGASKQIYTPQLAVHPGVQWEVTPAIRALRADVVNYRPALNDSGKPVAFAGDPADNPMDLWELKVATPNSKSREAVLASAAKQAESYSKLLKADMAYGVPRSLWDKIHAATSYSGYVDFFVIERQRCDQVDKNGKPVKTAIDWDFNVSGSPQYAGALVVERTDVESKCTDRREPSKETKDIKVKEPYSVGKPSLLDIVIDSLGHCGTSCLPSMPRIPSPVKQRMYADTAMFATDAPGIEYWQKNSSAVCAAIASIERVKGTATPIADLCERTLTFTELINSQEFGNFWNGLDVKDILELLKSIFSVFNDNTQSNVSNPARVNGDPHLITLDGLNYDLQSVGEFDLLEVPERELNIQARFVAAGTQSSTSAIATTWGDQTVELRADGTVLVNGEIQKIAPGSGIKFDEDETGYFLNDNGTYRLSWPGDEEGSAAVELSWQPMNASLGNLGVVVPPGVATRGLLGNNDGKASNDLSTREGAAVDPTDAVGIHDAYADSWRIVDAASLFTYGRGESTATYTDRSFPQQIVTTGDFPATDQAAAQQACDDAGVVAGPAFRNCVLDVLVTRNNDFALAFTGIDDTSRSADDKVMNADGKLTEAFSSATVAPNLRPLRSSKDDAYGDVAGPFNGSEQYRFHVPDLPRHDNVTVAFDLIALGQWDTADAVALRLDSQPAVPLDLTNATPGVLGDGTPSRTKRISMSLDHYRDLVGATLAGSGLTGPQRFAVDNLEVTAHVVAPDVFSPQLEAGVSTELRAPTLSAGAGVLERWGARDQYTVQLARQDVLLDWLTRSESVKWTLAKSTNGEVVAGGVSSDGNQRLRNLDGTYVLTVEGTGDAQPTSEAYSLNMLLTPKAERFTFELPGPVQLPADLPSPAVANGAGALETKLSTDLYAFAVTGKDRSVTINPTLCPTQNYRQRLSWTLLDGNGAAVDAGNCWSRTITGLQAGDYTLRVDPERETTGTYRITVTGNGPTTTFDPSPADASNKKSQTVSFAGTDEATAFECAIDAPSYTGPFSACSSPKTFSDLADGDHTIQVRAKDKDGNLGPAIKHIVTVDTAVPNMQITRKPPAQSNINGPVLEYSAEKRGMTYQCSLVPVGTAPSFEGCSGVSVYRDLKHGTYRFTVVGTDWVGNESTISYDFMVDLEPPVIDLVPPSNLTSTNAPQFTFTANEKATYECSLVLTSQPDAFAPCSSPKQYTGLSDGSQYRFLVKATDVAGQWSARGVTWTPYATPPSVTITSKPAASSSNAAPSFAFTSTMASPTFDCSLELASAAASFSSCTSPKTYGGKAAGTYKFTVKATDASGSWVSSTYQFTITAASSDSQAPSTPGTPTAVIAPAGASIGGDTDTPKSGIPLRISWTGSTDNVGVSGYQLWYSTNGAAYVNAGNTTGTAVTMNVAPGSTNLRFQIKAYDAAGNTSAASTASTATTVALDQETAASTLLTYSGTWTSASAASYSGGTAKYASATSAAATYKAPSGTTQVAVVMATGPSAGRATITVDGGSATTVDLYSSTAGYRTVALSTANLSATSAHTIVVKPAGTKNTSSSGTRVDLDAFATRR